MTYALTNQTPTTPEEFAAVDALIGDAPVDGLLARYTGTTDAGVAITSLWASKAHADRFFVERLRPAVEQLLGAPGGDGPMPSIAFEVTDEMVGAGR